MFERKDFDISNLLGNILIGVGVIIILFSMSIPLVVITSDFDTIFGLDGGQWLIAFVLSFVLIAVGVILNNVVYTRQMTEEIHTYLKNGKK